MTELENIGKLAATASELLNAIRGGEIANMKAEHTQTLEEFVAAYNAKINEFTQQKGEALNQFNQEKVQAFAAADSQLQSRRAAVDAVLGDLAGHTLHKVHYYDSVIHSKNSLGAVADPADNTKSEWLSVPKTTGSLSYTGVSSLCMLYAKRMYSYSAGYPDYVSDQSATRMQFIIANDSATSEQINQKIAEDGLELKNFGAWDSNSYVHAIEAIHINGLHGYKSLFVRFVNTPVSEQYAAQEITQFGGNAAFAIDKVLNYLRIPK